MFPFFVMCFLLYFYYCMYSLPDYEVFKIKYIEPFYLILNTNFLIHYMQQLSYHETRMINCLAFYVYYFQQIHIPFIFKNFSFYSVQHAKLKRYLIPPRELMKRLHSAIPILIKYTFQTEIQLVQHTTELIHLPPVKEIQK